MPANGDDGSVGGAVAGARAVDAERMAHGGGPRVLLTSHLDAVDAHAGVEFTGAQEQQDGGAVAGDVDVHWVGAEQRLRVQPLGVVLGRLRVCCCDDSRVAFNAQDFADETFGDFVNRTKEQSVHSILQCLTVECHLSAVTVWSQQKTLTKGYFFEKI